MRVPLVLTSTLAVAFAIGFACSSFQPEEAPADADAQARDATPRPDAASIDADADDPDPEPPPGLPEGWELDRSYDKKCGFYVPKSEAYLPPPLLWEPCPSNVLPAGASCKKMVVQGGAPNDPTFPSGYVGAGWVAPTGVVHLGVGWARKPSLTIDFIAEADGPTKSAILFGPKGCTLGFPSIEAARYSLRAYEGSALGGGAVAAEIASPRPRLAIHLPKEAAHSVFAAPFALLDLSQQQMQQYSWQEGAKLGILWSGAQDNNLQHGTPVFANGAMFWPMSNSLYHKVKVYSAATGVKDLLTAGLVADQGFGDLGTDGKDLVWIHAKNRKTQTGPFDDLEIMTAPFTTDGATLNPRRLRSEIGPDFDGPYFIVGCGFAARSKGTHLRIVRLADGRSWVLPGFVSGSPSPWTWSQPIALTCTELFARAFDSSTGIFVRLRLDSLGPGTPPD